MPEFSLRPFQLDDVHKIVRYEGGVIASEMGVGKTHQAIALDEAWWRKGCKPTLIVTPPNTFWSWQDKYGIQSPDSDVVLCDRTPQGREKFLEAIRRRQGDVFVCNYEALRLKDMKSILGMEFNTVVFDEAHRLASRKSQQTLAAKTVAKNSKRRLLMSGTLTGDQPDNLWSPLNTLWPSYYTSYWAFRNKYTKQDYDEDKGYRKIVGVRNIPELMEEIDPWYVRHLKKERCCDHHPDGVMPFLPKKSYSRVWVDLTPRQRDLYEQMRREMVAWVGENANNPMVASLVITQLVRLSQIALAVPEIRTVAKKRRKRDENGDFILPTEWEHFEADEVHLTGVSSKLDAVQGILEDHPGKQFVVFTSSAKLIRVAQERFDCVTLLGDTSARDRRYAIESFVKGKNQVFLATVDAAGEGIDGLQHATDTAIFIDRSWKTLKNFQAEDRLHRDGQENAVQIIDIMARGTLDFGRHQRLKEKWTWIKKMLGDDVRNTDMQYYKDDALTLLLGE